MAICAGGECVAYSDRTNTAARSRIIINGMFLSTFTWKIGVGIILSAHAQPHAAPADRPHLTRKLLISADRNHHAIALVHRHGLRRTPGVRSAGWLMGGHRRQSDISEPAVHLARPDEAEGDATVNSGLKSGHSAEQNQAS